MDFGFQLSVDKSTLFYYNLSMPNMTIEELKKLLDELRSFPGENEWIEFKIDNFDPQSIGEYISALSNSASLYRKEAGYLVYGVENQTHAVKGTNFRSKKKKIGNQELENWLATQLNPRIDFEIYEFDYNGYSIVLFRIEPTYNIPVRFKGVAYIRVGSYKKKLADHPEKERKIWHTKPFVDWSSQICEHATINDLAPEAIRKARTEFKQKYPKLSEEIDGCDDMTFLNKAKITTGGKMTNTAMLLLGKLESDHFISPSVAKISWILKNHDNIEIDYEHFGPPFLLNVDNLFSRVRNLKYRYLPDGTLFPIEVTKYDSWVIREALHNAVAHQDYELRGRINVVERPDELIFSNLGYFIPGTVEAAIRENSPPEIYRNPFLANAMVNLNMIDTIGGGIRKMFLTQWKRFFPLPDYDLSQPNRVIVKITGKILNENYTRLLMNKTDLDLPTIILLDKVQKGIRINQDEHKYLRKSKLTEGRYPNLYVSSQIASITGEKARYIKNRGFDNKYYKDLIAAYLKKNKQASRKDLNDLLFDKLPDILDDRRKLTKIKNLIYEMSRKGGIIYNQGSAKKPIWVLVKKGNDN